MQGMKPGSCWEVLADFTPFGRRFRIRLRRLHAKQQDVRVALVGRSAAEAQVFSAY